jgi:hypothetical protein
MAGALLNRLVTRVMKPTCPSCSVAIAPDDIDLREGRMLCRSCGSVSFLNRSNGDDPVASTLQDWSPDAPPVPRPAGAKTVERSTFDGVEFRRRTPNLAAGAFLAFWLTGWTAGCVFIVHQVILERSLFMALFAVPFVASWFLVAFILLNLWLGWERLILGLETLTYEWHVLTCLSRKQVALPDVRDIACFISSTNSDSGSRSYGLRIDTASGEIRLAKGAPTEELVWLTDTIRRHLHERGALPVASQNRLTEASSQSLAADVVSSSWSTNRTAATEVLTASFPPHERPADSMYTITREFNRTELSRRYFIRRNLGGFAGVTFINLFWNGIVGVFLLQLIQDFEWFLFVFLIPFEAIGLLLLGAWVATLTSPLWRYTWEFQPGQASRRFSILGFGQTRAVHLEGLDRLELRHGAVGKFKRWANRPTGDQDIPSASALCLVGEDGADLMVIEPVTENEARWIADALFGDFQQWFVPVRHR